MCFCHVRPTWQPVRTAGTLPSMPARLLCFLHTFGTPRRAGAVDLVSPAEPEQPAKPTIDQRLCCQEQLNTEPSSLKSTMHPFHKCSICQPPTANETLEKNWHFFSVFSENCSWVFETINYSIIS